MWWSLAWAAPSITPPVQGPAHEADAAVVVGIEDYAFVDDVPHAVADADAAVAWLTATRGVPPDRVTRLPATANREQLLEAVDAVAGRVDPALGTVWLYVAGQGSRAGREVLVLGVDAPAPGGGDVRARSVSQAELEQHAAAGGAPVVALYDLALGEAAAASDGTAVGTGTVVRWSATAPSPGARAWDRAGHGGFTFLALGALQGWAEGTERADEAVTLTEADAWVQQTLQALGSEIAVTRSGTRQDPMVRGTMAAVPEAAALQSLAAPAEAMDPCARPDWVDGAEPGRTVALEPGWPDPRLGALAAAATARRDRLLEANGQRARWAAAGWEVPATEQLSLQVTGRWRDCATGDQYAEVQAVSAVNPPADRGALEQRVQGAIGQPSGRPAWIDAPPVVPGVVLAVGQGADRDEARDLAVSDLGQALGVSGTATLTVYEVDGHARLEWALEAVAPVGCGQPATQVASYRDDAGWHYVLWAAPSGTAARAAAQACGEQLAGQRTMAEAKMRSLVSDARSRAASSPTAGLSGFKRALATARTMGAAVTASGSTDWFRGETTDQSLQLKSWAGVYDCAVQMDDMRLPAAVTALAGATPTNLEVAGVCTSLMPEASEARKGARR